MLPLLWALLIGVEVSQGQEEEIPAKPPAPEYHWNSRRDSLWLRKDLPEVIDLESLVWNPKYLDIPGEAMTPDEAKILFRHGAWKPVVQVYEHHGAVGSLFFARWKDKTYRLTRDRLGFFIDKIDSNARAMELAFFFHRGLLIREKADLKVLIEGFKHSEGTRVFEEVETSCPPACRFDEKKRTYGISFFLYEPLPPRIVKADYRVAMDGRMGYSLNPLAIGPILFAGIVRPLPENSPMLINVKDFQQQTDGILESIAVKLLVEDSLDDQGYTGPGRMPFAV